MLEIEIKDTEFWDEKTETFRYTEPCKLSLEHSLISLAKWESKWNKPFLSEIEKTQEEVKDYIRCMTVNRVVDPSVYDALTSEDYRKINEYIDSSMTATTFSEDPTRRKGRKGRRGEIMTAEVIYYYMISFGIPFECEKWHLARLLTLIRVCSIKNAPSKKMSKSAAAQQQRALNQQRRARLNSRG